MYKRIICLLLFIWTDVCGSADTIKFDLKKIVFSQRDVRWSVTPSVSASFTSYRNWLSEDLNTISILHSFDLRHRRNYVSGWSHSHLFKGEVGYVNYIDSLWIKNADNFKITFQWNEKPGRHLTHTYSFYLKSQFLNSYKYITENDTVKKKLSGWMMSPATVEIAYGFNWMLQEESSISIAFATCRFDAKPLPDNRSHAEDELFSIGKTVVYSEYGFSAQLYIKQEFIGKVLVWDHQGRYFYKALNKSGMHAEVSNRLTIRFLKFMQLRLDSQFIYDPEVTLKGSYKNEFLLGVFYEVNNSR